MRVSIILLAVTAAVLASASGASTFHLSKTASTDLEHSTVATQSAFKPQRRLRKHGSKLDLESDDEERANPNWWSEMLAGIKAVFNKVDDMDLKAANMIKGKTPEEAEEVYLKLVDGILPLLQGMERQNINPQTLTNHAKFKELSKNEAKFLQQFFKTYWETFPRMKNVET